MKSKKKTRTKKAGSKASKKLIRSRSVSKSKRKERIEKPSFLVLSDGSVFEGRALGSRCTEIGELVFHTAHSGYQEILTDPSYRKQIIVFAAAHIGNQGFHSDDWESSNIWASGCVFRNYEEAEYHWRKQKTVDEVLRSTQTPALFGVDTRRLILKIRQRGNLWAAMSTDGKSVDELKKQLQEAPRMEGLSLVSEVSTRSSYSWVTGSVPLLAQAKLGSRMSHKRCIVMDFGVKRQILRYLIDYGFEDVLVVPSTTSSSEILALNPDLVLLSNGPGDPASEKLIIEEVKRLHGKVPLFGICLGHQILALSLGLQTHKLPFGHHAANHPVMNLLKQKVEISSQNHGFAVDGSGARKKEIEITHINMNDQSVAGFIHRGLRIQGIQYHPESSPGPLDSLYLFEEMKREFAA